MPPSSLYTKDLRALRRAIGHNIHMLRRKQKMSLKKLSIKTHIAIDMLDAFELGKYEIELSHMIAISAAFDMQASRLMLCDR